MADSIVQISQANNQAPTVLSGSTALAANVNRQAWGIQNQGTNALYVLLASGCLTNQYHFILKPGSAVADGNGGIFTQQDGVCYQGIVTVAGTGRQFTVFELGG